MIHIDSHYVIGQTHLNNEDYAISGEAPVPYMILADGCSSSEHSDVGARMLVMAAQEYLLEHAARGEVPATDSLELYAALTAEAAARVIGAPSSAIDATLILSFVLDGKAYVYLYGDGALITRDRAGRIRVINVDYSHNAPYYPSYQINRVRDTQYRTLSVGAVKTLDDDGVQTMADQIEPAVFTFPVNELATLLIASDGLSSFINTHAAQSVTTEEAASRLADFRNVNGDFVKRKLKRCLKNWAKDGVLNSDDLSLGAMVFR